MHWAKSYGKFTGASIKQRREILLAGHTRKTPLSKNLDVQMKKLDKQGKSSGQNSSGSPEDMMGNGFMMRFGGQGLLQTVAGWRLLEQVMKLEGMRDGSSIGPSGQWKIYLIKTDAMGNLQWEGVYGSFENDWAGEDVCITADGGHWWQMTAEHLVSRSFHRFSMNRKRKTSLEKFFEINQKIVHFVFSQFLYSLRGRKAEDYGSEKFAESVVLQIKHGRMDGKVDLPRIAKVIRSLPPT